MASFYTNETKGRGDQPPRLLGNEAYGGRERVFRATIPLDAPPTSNTAAGTQIASGDTVVLCTRPAGMRFAGGTLVSSVSLGTAQIAVGVAGTPAKYRAAATFTAVDTPTPFGPAARFADDAPSADEEIILTVSVAALPNTAGAKLVVDLYFAGP